jgi:cytosine/adenosine deaminase-related metal-dependent hydrolase
VQLLTSSWVVPMDRPPIRDGRVAVDGGGVVWVGAPGAADEPRDTIVDLGPGVILPGLVNAHCHLELSYLQGRIPLPRPFVGWVRDVVASRGAETPNVVRAGVERAIRQLLDAGTVAVGDVSNELAHLDLLAASGLRAVVFHELIGWDPDRAEAVLAAADERLAELPRDLPAKGVSVRLAAHAPHSVSPALLRRLTRDPRFAALHLAESAAERLFLESGDGDWPTFLRERGLEGVRFEPAGVSPVRYVESLGVLRPGVLAVHCVQTDPADHAALARGGVRVAVCPRSNRNLEVGQAPVPELLAAGVPVCLGTDSLASAGTLNVMDDVRALRQAFPELPAAALMRMVTLEAAAALGFDDLGSIAPGKRAALAHAAARGGVADPLEFLVSAEANLKRIAA